MTVQKRPSKETWAKVRAAWEADPRDGYQWVVSKFELGTSDKAVLMRAKRESWAKTKTLEQLRVSAHRIADERNVTQDVTQVTNQTDASINLRASIIEQHRKDCEGIRSALDVPLVVADIEAGKAMKTGIEAVTALHALERKAYALDEQPPEALSGGASIDEVNKMLGDAIAKAKMAAEAKAMENAAHETHG